MHMHAWAAYLRHDGLDPHVTMQGEAHAAVQVQPIGRHVVVVICRAATSETGSAGRAFGAAQQSPARELAKELHRALQPVAAAGAAAAAAAVRRRGLL